MNIFISLTCLACWAITAKLAQYALHNDSGHSGIDFQDLGIAALILGGVALVGLYRKHRLSGHLLIAASVLCATSFFVRYFLILPYEIWVHEMNVSIALPIFPGAFFWSLAIVGGVCHACLIWFARKSPTENRAA